MDDIIWAGNVEIHVRSSDWYAHGHHQDPAYCNVILHVVLFNDIEVTIHERVLPTLELKSYIDSDHHEKYSVCRTPKIPCENILHRSPSLPFFKLVESSLIHRLQRKVHLKHLSLNTMQWFYTLIAQSFGSKVNDLPFEVLSNHVPWSTIKTLKRKSRFNQLLVASSLFPTVTNSSEGCNVFSIENYWWKRKGQYAYSQPQKRVLQFAAFISHLPDGLSFVNWKVSDVISFFTKLLVEAFNDYGIGINAKHSFILRNLLINAVAPLLFHFGRISSALSLLQSLSPENNYITRKFQSMGISPSTAAESQMLLEVHGQFCAEKKCLNCAVGLHIFAK